MFDSNFLKKGESYNKLPQIISLIFTTEPLKDYDNGKPVADFVIYDLLDNKIVNNFGLRTIIINGKYKSRDFEEFTNLIEDLQKSNPEDVKNPVIKEILFKTKYTKEGRSMYSKFFEERYGDVIRENEVLNEKLQNANKQILKNQEELQKAAEQSKKDQKEIIALKDTLKQNGIPYPIIDS